MSRFIPTLPFLSLLLALNLLSSANTSNDSIPEKQDSTRVLFFYNDFEKLGILNLHANDTATAGFQNYDKLYKNNRFYATLGNIGQNSKYLVPFVQIRQSGFDYGVHTADPYLYENDSIHYFKVYKTYTELTYDQGAKKEQSFHAIFSRNIYRSLNLGFDFNVMSAPGAYTRQKTNHVNFVLTTQFFTKNKRYGVIANFTINRLRNYENGGLKYDSLFEQNIYTNRAVIPVNLAQAQNRVRETGFYMKHYFDLTRHSKYTNDSIPERNKRFELGRITYAFQYNRKILNYIDNQPDSGFYPKPLYDSIQTIDSVTIVKFMNDVTWSNPSFDPDKKFRVFRIEAGIRQQYIETEMRGKKNYFIQLIPHAEINFVPIPSIRLLASGDYVLGDFNEGDLALNVKLNSTLGRSDKNFGTISLTGKFISQQAGWFYEHYSGNNYQWDTTWKKQNIVSGGFSYAWKFFETGLIINRIQNYVYLDSLSLPRQNRDQFGHFYLYLNGNINVWRFNFQPQLVYQSIQGTTLVRVPSFMGNLAIYYSQPLFRGAALLQPGLNFFYNTSYYADRYNPALRSFAIQDQREIGNYIYMDVFINLKIQRARLFAMYSHFNASFMGYQYYTTPDYPMQDGAFKFGVAWRFHD